MAGAVFGVPALASATCTNQQSCSGGYGVNEVFFGNGGSLDSTCSGSYCAKQAVGETGAGNTVGTLYQAQGGFDTNRTPSLTFCVYVSSCGDTPSINAGTLTAGTTATGTIKFSVKTYLASGYQVVTYGAAPTNGNHTLNALSSPASPSSASEQFGINLVANNSCGGGMPASLGASPVQVPDSTFSFGAAAHNGASDYYDTVCKFMYASGDTIALATKSSGETDFTISYIFNTTAVTPGGIYSMAQSLVATSTF